MLRRGRVKDLAIYVSINSLIIAAIFGLFAAGMSWNFFIKYIGLALMTALVFWPLGKILNAHPGGRKVWIATALLLAFHGGVWLLLLRHITYWKFIWFYPMILELPLLAALGPWLLRKRN